MEMEYVPAKPRGRLIVLLGVILALGAGGAAFIMLSQAQEQASLGNIPRIAVVVAAHTIPARKTIESGDLAIHEVPVDVVPVGGAIIDTAFAIGHVAAVPILEGQPITANLFATSSGTGLIAVLGPEETIGPDSPVWRAVALNVPDDRALGGLLEVGQTVDVFATIAVNVPVDLTATADKPGTTTAGATASPAGNYYPDRSTKITYQDVPILAKSNTYYIVKVTQTVAEEIAHLEASGDASFSFALRPDIDNRVTDASGLGETTNLIIERYGLPIPEPFPNKDSVINNPVAGTPQPLPYVAVGSPAPSP
jgi:Flp pilus assembly protein CpaB